MVQSAFALRFDPSLLLLAALAVAASYFLLGLVVAAATRGRVRAVAERLTRTAAIPAIVGVGSFAFVATLPPSADDLVFALGSLAVVLAIVAAPVLAVMLAFDADAVE